MRYMIQVRGEWGGATSSAWRPAITGTINQTGRSDIDASTFDKADDAVGAQAAYMWAYEQGRAEFRIEPVP